MAKLTVKNKNFWVFSYWNGVFVAFASGALALASLLLALWVQRLLRPIANFDEGVLLQVVSCMFFVGCMVGILGAYIAGKCAKKNRAYILRYSIYSYLGWGFGIILVFFGAGVSIFLDSDFSKVFTPGINLNVYPNDSYTRSIMDDMQTTLKCCGYHKHTEWFEIRFSVTVQPGQVALPDSCCSESTATCVREVSTGEVSKLTYYKEGCIGKAAHHYATVLRITAAFLFLVGLSEGAVVAFFCFQARGIEKPKPTELTQLLETRHGKTNGSVPFRKSEVMNLKHDIASVQSFFDAPKISRSQLWWNKKTQRSDTSVKATQ